jgi:hypothetical protein
MNGKRTYWQLLLASAGVGLLITNCTVKSASDSGTCTVGSKTSGCTCAGNVIGSQTCLADGTYGACVCAAENGGTGGSTSTTGGTTSTNGGTSNGGSTATTTAGSGGYAGSSGGTTGEAGAAAIDPTDCGACLATLCPTQWQACEADPQCLSAMTDGSGQYERIIACVDGQRANGLVKRDVVRGCGVTIGASPDPDLISAWAPEGMAATTTNLLNCMADAPGAAPASWANDDANYPLDAQMVPQPAPWPAGTCAKLACTSQITN